MSDPLQLRAVLAHDIHRQRLVHLGQAGVVLLRAFGGGHTNALQGSGIRTRSCPCPALVLGVSAGKSTRGFRGGGRTRSSAVAEPGTTRSRSLAHGPRILAALSASAGGGGAPDPGASRLVTPISMKLREGAEPAGPRMQTLSRVVAPL